jgi:hypothetical protein
VATHPELDYSQFYENLESYLRNDLSIDFAMRSTISFCQSQFPEKNFDALLSLDYTEEAKRFHDWIVEGLRNDPSEFEIASMYVGLGDFHTRDNVEICDMYVMFLDGYVDNDKELSWLWSARRHYPGSRALNDGTRYFNSTILRQFGFACNGNSSDSLGTPTYITLCNSYLALMVHHGVTSNVGISPRSFGVAGGFDGGDLQHLGSIGPSGHSLGALPLI